MEEGGDTTAEPVIWAKAAVVRALRVALVSALALYALHAAFWVGGEDLGDVIFSWVHLGLMFAAAGICLARAQRDASERAAWLSLALALSTYAGGELAWEILYEDLPEPPYPSLSDALWLIFYPASYAALIFLIRPRLRRFHASLWLDGLVGALAAAALAAAVVFAPVLEAIEGSAAALGTTLAYPVGDVLLLGFVVGVFALTGWRPGRSWALLGAGLALNAVADVIYTVQSAEGTFVEGSLPDTLFPAAALTLAWAAFEPSQSARKLVLEGRRMLFLPAGFWLVAVGLTVLGVTGRLNGVAAALTIATLLAVMGRAWLTFRENGALLERAQHEACSDPLTGLANRRSLLADLEDVLAERGASAPHAFVLFDLDGFKDYNDAFGHAAGDALLVRLGQRLQEPVRAFGRAYRLGGDEFCVLARGEQPELEALLGASLAALSEEGEGFSIGATCGKVLLPAETSDAGEVLTLADRRMYANKAKRRSSAGAQARAALLSALHEREPKLHQHHRDVAELSRGVARRLDLDGEAVDEVVRAAELHDVGKVAIPEAILTKPAPLDEREWAFMQRHTLIGERIVAAAPALGPVARLVRSSHERFDGEGYPDRLVGEEIPLGSRIIAVCDAYDTMVTGRPYQPAMDPLAALEELRRCSGAQFDPAVVEALLLTLADLRPTVGLPSRDAADDQAVEVTDMRERRAPRRVKRRVHQPGASGDGAW